MLGTGKEIYLLTLQLHDWHQSYSATEQGGFLSFDTLAKHAQLINCMHVHAECRIEMEQQMGTA